MPAIAVPLVAELLITFGAPALTALDVGIAVGTGLAALTSPLGLTILSVGLSVLARSSLSDRGSVRAPGTRGCLNQEEQ